MIADDLPALESTPTDIPARILFYAVNGLGLGHVTRLLAIANKVRELRPDSEIVFCTSSEAEDVIFREGFAAIKIPSKTICRKTNLRPSTYSRIAQTVTLNLVSAFHPHVLVVDTFPAGSMQELLPVLRWDSRKVFVFRDQKQEYSQSPLTQNTLRLYDLAVIPHSAGEADIPLPPGMENVWTGPILIRERDRAASRNESRRALGLPQGGKLVYVSFGGGGDEELNAATEQAIDAVIGIDGLKAVVPKAPLNRVKLLHPDILMVNHYPMAEYFQAFDAAISAGGYNSVNELLHHGVPSVFVPFHRHLDDQYKRVARFVNQGACESANFNEVGSIRGALANVLAKATGRDPQTLVPGGGAQKAAESIVALLKS